MKKIPQLRNKLVAVVVVVVVVCALAVTLIRFFINANHEPVHTNNALFTFTTPQKIELYLGKEHITLLSEDEQTWVKQGDPQERIRHNTVSHLLSILSSLGRTFPEDVLASNEATQVNLDAFSLKITLHYNRTRLDLTFYDLGAQNGVALLKVSGRPEVYKVASQPLQLLGSMGLSALYDRRITTFETDDVEVFKTSGKCRPLAFSRDGDSWIISEGTMSVSSIELFLDELTSIAGNGRLEIDPSNELFQHPWCTLSFEGRNERRESVVITDITQPSVCLINIKTQPAKPTCYNISTVKLELIK